MIRTHNLKIMPCYFKDIANETKTFEVRKNDRFYKLGDILKLEEFDQHGYTGRYVSAEITYLFDNPDYVKEGYVVLGIKLRLDKGAAT